MDIQEKFESEKWALIILLIHSGILKVLILRFLLLGISF